MTRQKRKAIYTEAKENIIAGNGFEFLCGQFSTILTSDFDKCIDLLPEFKLFKPTEEEEKEYGLGLCWFKFNGSFAVENEYRQLERLICLDLCLLMIKDKYFD